MRGIRTRCRRTPSASRARCICIAIACASSPAASAPTTSDNSSRGGRSILPEHRAQRVAAVSGKRARRYLQRQHLLDLGADALEYLTELTHRRPRTWIPDVERLHTLLQTHGDVALRAAFARGVADQAFGAEYIAHYLGTTVPSLPFEDRPSTIEAVSLPRAGRVQAAAGARRAGAKRRAWTRPSTAASVRGVGGRS